MNETAEPTTLTITTEMVDEIQRAWRRTVHALVALVLVALLLVVGAVGFLGYRSYQSQDRSECTAHIEGLTLGLAFEALAAPPAPNPARGKAVEKGLHQARRLQHLDDYC